MTYLLAALAALMGAAGVAAGAAAAHTGADPRLAIASQMLMVHAAAGVALLALGRGSPAPTAFLAATGLLILGVALFAGDLAARHYLGDRLFPMAAPIGGSLTIVGWVVAAGAALAAFLKR